MRPQRFLVLCVVLALSSLSFVFANSASLDDTMKWIKGKLSQDFVRSDKVDGFLIVDTYQSQVLGYQGCVLRVLTVSSRRLVGRLPEGMPHMNGFKTLYEVNVGSLSPDGGTIKEERPQSSDQSVPTWFSLKLSTTDGVASVSENSTVISDDGDGASRQIKGSSMFLRFDDKSLAERVQKAFSHAATKCGASPEPF
jgi:hypothetical protein